MENKKFGRKLKAYMPLSARGWLVYFMAMAVASTVCVLLRRISTTDVHVPLIFVLAVLVVALMTDGYFYGILAALTSVVTVNYAFTYPYAKMDFSIYGYPLTFMTMLAVGCAVSTLTSRVREQERLRMESEREKVRANLLRAVSHDLRTPLTTISGAISAVLDGEETLSAQQRRELLQDAREDADWLYRMVENLLSITRISGGQVNGIQKREEMLEEVLSEAVVNFKKRSPSVSVTVSVPDTLLFVPMDAMLIEQVLLNLMDNAVFHGGAKLISLEVTAKEDVARITVSDNGTGVRKELLEHLFDGSIQLREDRSSDNTRGMGIGLTVCRTIVEAHGGKIYAENIPGSGARFIFTLPLEGEENEYQG